MVSGNSDNKLVTVIIPNINGLEHLKTCYSSILKQTYSNFKVILIDNNSTDGSVEFTVTEFPMIEIIKFDHNSGFAKAVNAGIEAALKKHNTSYILLLNNDIELTDNFLEEAISTFNSVPDADIVASKMMNFYDRSVIDDTGNFITKKGGTAYPRGNGQKDTGQYDTPEYIFGACAGAAFYRKEVFEKTGLFDEDFFAYLEDIDLSFRAQLAGLKCYYQPKCVCYHKRGGSTISTIKFQMKMNERNGVWLRFKNFPFLMYVYYQPLLALSRIKRLAGIYSSAGLQTALIALWGYILGIAGLPLQIIKRLGIQRTKKVSDKYIRSLFR